jgi:adenylate cyclase
MTLKRIWQSSLARYLALSLLVSVISLVAMQLPVWTSLNSVVGDLLQGEVSARPEIVVVAIDDASLGKLGAWPWTRDIFADGLGKILAGEPKVIGVDVLFLESREGDAQLKQVLKDSEEKIILGAKLADGELLRSVFNLSDPQIPSGYVNFISGVDGKIRSANLWQKVNAKCELSLALSVYAKYLSLSTEQLQQACARSDFDTLSLRGRDLQTSAGQVTFTYATSDYQRVSFADIISGKVSPTTFKDKIVMVGSTALDLRSNLNDNFTDIFGQSIPGIEIHSNIINSFLQDKFLQQPPLWAVSIFMLAATLALSVVYSRVKRDVFDLLIFLEVLALQLVAVLFLYSRGVQWPLLTSSGMLVVNYVFALIYRFVNKSKENRYVKQVFSRYLSGKLLNKLLAEPENLKLGGDLRNMTVLFSDIRSFTTISEGLTSTELVHMLNDYLNYMTNIILRHDGTIDKYIGDAIMAFWNAPLDDAAHAAHGLQAALEMKVQLAEFVAAHPEYPLLQIGIGVNTGDMTVGNVGGDARFDYTVLGDNVNLGARLEGLTKKYGVTILCTEATVQAYTGDQIIFRLLDIVKVKGKNQAVFIYEPFFDSKEDHALIVKYAAAFELYKQGDFAAAAKQLKLLAADDPASAKLLERCEALADAKPTDWQGIWTWDEK